MAWSLSDAGVGVNNAPGAGQLEPGFCSGVPVAPLVVQVESILRLDVACWGMQGGAWLYSRWYYRWTWWCVEEGMLAHKAAHTHTKYYMQR